LKIAVTDHHHTNCVIPTPSVCMYTWNAWNTDIGSNLQCQICFCQAIHLVWSWTGCLRFHGSRLQNPFLPTDLHHHHGHSPHFLLSSMLQVSWTLLFLQLKEHTEIIAIMSPSSLSLLTLSKKLRDL
jgi:hypothetical protein